MISTGVAASHEVALHEVVPRTVDADFNDVAGELVDGRAEALELAGVTDASAVGALQPVAVHVGDVPEPPATAHGADGVGVGPDVAGGTQELGVGVAHLVATQLPLAEVAKHHPLGECVVGRRHVGSVPVAGRYRAGVRSVDELTGEYLDRLCDAFPVTATALGRHERDGELGGYDPTVFDEFAGDLAGLLAELAAYVDPTMGGDADPGHDAEAHALHGVVKTRLLEIEEEQQWRRNPAEAVDTALMGCFSLMLRDYAPAAERHESLRSRLAAMPGFLHDARATWSDVPALWADTAAESARAGASFLREELRAALGDSPSAGAVLAAAEPAAKALDDTATAVDAMPTIDGGWSIGEELVARHLRVEHHLDDSPSEMEARGLALVDETVAALKDLDPDWRATLAATKNDHPAAGELVNGYRTEMERAHEYVRETGLAPLTDAPLEVRPTPSFWVPVLPYASYDPPGPFESDQSGIFWVTVPDGDAAPERLRGHPRPGMTVTAVHEGYPGHHLQLTHANAHASLTRTIADSTLTIEGWAFYCEQMLAEVGYYGDDLPLRLYQLRDQLWRAARVVLDMRLHTGDISYDDAIDYLVDVADLERPNAEAEVRRYTSTPTYQICYAIGKAEILKIRDERQRRDPAGFDLGAFHRELLDYGSIAVPLSATAMLGA